jgi:hypothetical protein
MGLHDRRRPHPTDVVARRERQSLTARSVSKFQETSMTFQQNILSETHSIHTPSERSWAPEEARFTALEWQVIALAERDPMSSIREPGRIATAMGSIFGGHTHSRLADAQLEGLRRSAVIAWHGPTLSDGEIADFLEAGYSHEHLTLLRKSIRRRKNGMQSQSDRAPPIGYGLAPRPTFRATPMMALASGASV